MAASDQTMSDRKSSARVWIFRWLNLALWLAFCALTGTGLLLAFRLPPGSRGGRGLEAWGMGRHEWGDIHTWLSYIFIGLLILHVALHWRWLWQIAARRRAWPIALGIGTSLALVLFLILQPVHPRPGQERNPFPKHNSKIHNP